MKRFPQTQKGLRTEVGGLCLREGYIRPRDTTLSAGFFPGEAFRLQSFEIGTESIIGLPALVERQLGVPALLVLLFKPRFTRGWRLLSLFEIFHA